MSERASWAGLCGTVVDGASWDLDVGDLVGWTRALRICQEACPFKVECAEQRAELYPGAEKPRGVIWAGAAYSGSGKVLDAAGLRRLAANQRAAVAGEAAPRSAAC